MNGRGGIVESIIAIVTLLCVVGFLLWFIRDQREHFATKEARLLDRIMVRNFETLVQADVVRDNLKKSLTAEEIMELQTERGIPV
jgi:Ca2+/Na+ antiporter